MLIKTHMSKYVLSSFLRRMCAVLAWTCLASVDVAAQTCVNESDCSGASYVVKKDFSLTNPSSAPSIAAGPITGGSCSASETYKTYVAWCNESGCTAVSPESGTHTPSSGITNLIAVTRPAIPAEATSWAVYYSKSGDSHLQIRNCNSTTELAGTVAAASSTENCRCLLVGGLHQSLNATGIAQTNKLDPDGAIKFSGKDGTVQEKLVPEKSIVEFSQDLIPRISADSGANFRTVDWNSATVFYVEPNFGASNTTAHGRTVFSSIFNALIAINESSYTKPYVIRFRNKDGGVISGATINKPYVWLQGDGGTRVGALTIMADGVRVSGLITPTINVGDEGVTTEAADVDNVWITNNIVTSDSVSSQCKIDVHVGGGDRTHAVFVSNNRLGGSNDPSSSSENRCFLKAMSGDPGAGTVVTFSDNYVESHQCIHGYNAMVISTGLGATSSGNTVISQRNTFVCNPVPGIQEPGNDCACIMASFAFARFRSIDDTCILTRVESGPYARGNLFMQVEQNYADTIPRSAELINPTLIVNLPASHFPGDRIAYLEIDTPYVTFSISNPRYRELALGSGWSASDKHFAIVDGSRPTPPNGANTFLRWDNVVEAPGNDIAFTGGATAASIDAAPTARVLPEHFGDRIMMTGATLGSTCRPGELRYETGGATKEICACDPADTWTCFPLGALQD